MVKIITLNHGCKPVQMKIILLFCEAKCPYKSVLHSIGLKIKLSTISAALPWLIELSFPLKGARLLFVSKP